MARSDAVFKWGQGPARQHQPTRDVLRAVCSWPEHSPVIAPPRSTAPRSALASRALLGRRSRPRRAGGGQTSLRGCPGHDGPRASVPRNPSRLQDGVNAIAPDIRVVSDGCGGRTARNAERSSAIRTTHFDKRMSTAGYDRGPECGGHYGQRYVNRHYGSTTWAARPMLPPKHVKKALPLRSSHTCTTRTSHPPAAMVRSGVKQDIRR